MKLSAPIGPGPHGAHRLGDGTAGIALALVEQARRGTTTWQQAHQAVSAVAREPVSADPRRISLFRGAPAVGYLLHRAARPGYRRALGALDDCIATAIRQRLADAHARIRRREPTRFCEYDLISGLTGLGLYQMIRHDKAGLLPDILGYVVALTAPLRLDGRTLPGWWCATGPAGTPSQRYPGGHANLGMAHGIAGPVALLSAAMNAGIEVPGHREAIERICAYLDTWQQHDTAGTWWPETINRAEHAEGRPARTGPGRPSWCYGVPGIARAQQHAARALRDPSRAHRAQEALAAALTDDRQLRQITDAGLCHGWAGLWHTTRRVAADVEDPRAWETTLRTVHRRMEDHLGRLGSPHRGGLLDGRAGIGLAKHTAPNGPPREDWDACLLLTFPPPSIAPTTP